MSTSNQFALLKQRAFLPLFITQALEAFNDNLFKITLITIAGYLLKQGAAPGQDTLLQASVFTIFVVPFFLFSATAGQIADKFSKTILIRIIKAFEVGCTVLAGIGIYQNNFTLLLITLFLLSTHSAFFGPIKYSILPELVAPPQILAGNALIEASTFLAILVGTVLGSSLFVLPPAQAKIIVFVLLTGCALIGWISSFLIPKTANASPSLKINLNFVSQSWQIINHTRQYRDVFLSILGISWFWFVGAIFLTEITPFTTNYLHGDPNVNSAFLTAFSFGIAVGSLLCNQLLKGEINTKYVPVGIIGMTIFMLDIAYTAHLYDYAPNSAYISLGQFLSGPWHNWRLLLDSFLIALLGGTYIVPLYAVMQTRTPNNERSRIIAGNNVLNSMFLVLSAILFFCLSYLHFHASTIFLTVALLNAAVAIYICKIIPQAVVKSFVNWFFRVFYHAEIKNLENYKNAGDRVIIIANHTSFIDVLLLAAFLPDTLTFAINTEVAKKWWLKPVLRLVETFPIDPTSPMSTKGMIKIIKAGKKCVIFPEGRLTVTGALMKIYQGPVMIAEKSDAMIVPIRIDGVQYTPFSRLRGKLRTRWFPKITLTVLPACKLTPATDATKQAYREAMGQHLYRIMTDMMFESSRYQKTLFRGLLDARKIHGGDHPIAEDIQRQPLNYNQFIMRCYVIGRYLKTKTAFAENVGVLLPTSVNTLLTFFGLQAYGRVPAMLNYSAGFQQIDSACKTAKVKLIITARPFVAAAKLDGLLEKLSGQGLQIIYLDDLKSHLGRFAKLSSYLISLFATWVYRAIEKKQKPSEPAVILFTSGSEGSPKGVVLSHSNLLANCFQLASVIDFTAKDLIFNFLPTFHCFGLTAGGILPLVTGIKVFFYPSPLHYSIIPELIYDTNATILFGTDTFLNGYARKAHPYDFYSVRYLFAGAEKVKPQTFETYAYKFGIRIFEGYGATETAPVISFNTPMQNKPGTVGSLLPGIEYRLEKVEGIAEGGRLWVRGPNVMLGYLLADQPGKIIPAPEQWHDTGDIVKIDTQGYITILGRAKRFAKIGGEMVSLTAVELYITALWPNHMHAVVTIPDPRKGEQLILLTNNSQAKRDELVAYARQQGINELSVPKKIVFLEKLPLLATGKIDYPATQQLVSNLTVTETIEEPNE